MIFITCKIAHPGKHQHQEHLCQSNFDSHPAGFWKPLEHAAHGDSTLLPPKPLCFYPHSACPFPWCQVSILGPAASEIPSRYIFLNNLQELLYADDTLVIAHSVVTGVRPQWAYLRIAQDQIKRMKAVRRPEHKQETEHRETTGRWWQSTQPKRKVRK